MKKIFTIVLILLAGMMQAEVVEQMSHNLKQVTTVSAGKYYVFVRNGRALKAEEVDGYLQTTDQFKMTGVKTTDSYVWKIGNVPNSEYFSIAGNTSPKYLGSGTDGKFGFFSPSASGGRWKFEFSKNDSAKIYNVISSTNYYLCESNKTNEYYVNSTKGKCSFAVYELVPTSYTRPVGTNIGSICLPFACNEYTGATFYELAYKEEDGSGNPTKIYYEEAEGTLIAGKPYVFVPNTNASAITMSAVADSQVDAPITTNTNGFYGTFTNIENNAILQNNYVISSNTIQKCGTGCSMGAWRAYIKMDEVPTQNTQSAPIMRRMLVVGQNDAPEIIEPGGVVTNIEVRGKNEEVRTRRVVKNGQVIIVRGGVEYTILGGRAR